MNIYPQKLEIEVRSLIRKAHYTTLDFQKIKHDVLYAICVPCLINTYLSGVYCCVKLCV